MTERNQRPQSLVTDRIKPGNLVARRRSGQSLRLRQIMDTADPWRGSRRDVLDALRQDRDRLDGE